MRIIFNSAFLIVSSLFFLSCVHMEKVASLEEAFEVSKSQGHLIDVDHDLLRELQTKDFDRITIVEYYADWCHVCRSLTPKLASLARSLREKATVGIFNLSRQKELPADLEVSALPSFDVYLPNKEVIRLVGGDKLEAIQSLVQSYPSRPEPFTFRQDKLKKAARFFLVGGANDINNFGIEVLWHTAFLQEIGIPADEIACYFTEPEISNFYSNQKDFQLLAKNARNCFELTKARLLQDIETSLEQGVDELYLYISSHGNEPIKAHEEQAEALKQCPPANLYRIVIGSPMDIACDPSQYIFPSDLYQVLKKYPEVNKKLVIQACHSGGFIDEAMQALPNITIMTASRADRVSFGCHPDERFTYFGQAFLRTLSFYNDWTKIDWQAAYRKTARLIRRRESSMSLSGDQRSLPQFFTSRQAQQ